MRSIKGLRICWFLCLHNSFHNHAEAVWSFFQIASVDQQKALESCCYKIISNTTSKFISTAAAAAAAAAKSLQSCPTLCDPRDGSPPGSPVPGILQARALEWGATLALGNLKRKETQPKWACGCQQIDDKSKDDLVWFNSTTTTQIHTQSLLDYVQKWLQSRGQIKPSNNPNTDKSCNSNL